MSAAIRRSTPLLAALLLCAAALLAPFNHDEDQYFAAARLVGSGWPYRDWVYLQTPLFAWWGAAVLAPFEGWSLIAGRLSQALLGAALLGLVWRTLLALDVPRRRAALATLALLCCQPFLFTATAFRNDMLAAVFEAAALASLASRAREPVRVTPVIAFAAGTLICLGASVKVNYGLVGIAPLAWLIMADLPWRARLARIAALGAGALVGLAPTLLALAADPAQMVFQTVTYAAEAPFEWYRAVGQDFRLSPLGRTRDVAMFLLLGPQGVALALVAWHRWRLWRGEVSGERPLLALLDWAILAALVAALVPVPTWRQYFLVLFPPLFLRLPFAFAALEKTQRRWNARALGFFALVGVTAFAVQTGPTFSDPARAILNHQREARWLGAELAQAGQAGARVVTLSPHVLLDAGAAIDPRLATGPFVYRWRDPARQAEIAASHALTVATLPGALDAAPPPALVTGYERRFAGDGRFALDRPLEAWARAHGYRPLKSPYGGAVLWLRPPLAAPRPAA